MNVNKRRIAGMDRENPCLFEAISRDPTLLITPESKADQVRDLQRWTRYWLFPVLRFSVVILVRLIVLVKRLLPFQFASEKMLNLFGVFFLERVLSPEAERFVLRHFCIESGLINFIARNSGAKEGDVEIVDLLPSSYKDVGEWRGQNAIVRHDRNLFNLFIDLGTAPGVDVANVRPLADLDFRDITIPNVVSSPERRKIINLDLHSSMYLTVVALALFLDEKTAERAVNSFQFDEGLTTCIANLTGDHVFRTWTPLRFATWLGSPTHDAARDLHWHMLVNEYSHTRLLQLAEAKEKLM